MPPKSHEALFAAETRSNNYPDFFAFELKKALAAEYSLETTNIITVAGSSALIDIIGCTFINPGDEVLYCSPTYEAFADMANAYGGVPAPIPLAGDLSFDLDGLYNAITPKTKIVVIVNPNNPTGGYVPSSKIEEFIRKAPDDILIVVDEAYIDFVDHPDNYSMVKLIQEGIDKPVLILRTFSKIYGMAGIRVGYGVSSPEVIDELAKSSHAWNVSNVSQAAAIVALGEKEFIANVKSEIVKGREYVSRELKRLGCAVNDTQANFIYFSSPLAPEDITAALKEKDVLIATFAWSRVSIGTPEENRAFIDALEEVLAEVALKEQSPA
jgi:histidinol-phosphate aminotransferase